MQSLKSQDEKPKLHGCTASQLASKGLTEAQASDALIALHADQCNFITKVGIENQQGKYAINWQAAFLSLQSMLIERYVEQTYCAHHVRVYRILKAKGFVEEKELTKLSLLPQKNIRVIISRMISDGLFQMQEVPQSLRNTTQGVLFGLSFGGRAGQVIFKKRVEQAIINLLERDGKLGPMQNLCLEMNHLNF